MPRLNLRNASAMASKQNDVPSTCCSHIAPEVLRQLTSMVSQPPSLYDKCFFPTPRLCVSPQKKFLPPPSYINRSRKTLVLDLDETLVHSTFAPGCEADFVVSVKSCVPLGVHQLQGVQCVCA